MCPGDRLANAGSAPAIRCSARSPRRRRWPIRTHVRRPTRPPLLYFAAVLPVRYVRISLLTSGAKRARTADLLHAIWRQHVHPRPSVQVTVLPRPRKSARVPVSCGTSVLYRCHPRRGTSRGLRCGPDQHQPYARLEVRPSACIRSSKPQQPAPRRSVRNPSPASGTGSRLARGKQPARRIWRCTSTSPSACECVLLFRRMQMHGCA
jgi:hypothetical protein